MPDVQSAYTQWSATYDTDRNLTRDLDQSVTRALLSTRRYHTVLELGCGTGKNTAFLATVADRVHAVDFSDGMLAQARAKNFPPHVTFAPLDLTQRPWPFPDASADLITCNLVLEHIPDLTPVFAESARALAPAGTVLVSELHPIRQYLGAKAHFHQPDQTRVEPPAYPHPLTDFLTPAASAGLSLSSIAEHWHPTDDRQASPPRLLTLLFTR